jgi:type VI secretion system secreted protein Hcp
MAVFIKFNGVLGLEGEATDKDHQGWTELLSYSLGGNQPSTAMGVGSGSNSPSVKEINCTKENDTISAALFQFAARGDIIPSVLIDNTTAHGNKAQVTFLQIELKNVVISSFSTSTAGDTPKDFFSLNFTEMNVRYVTC